jgi:AbrB family looped-hinge helix DNA binding protein
MTPKGQVTIPAELRQRVGLWPEMEVEFEAREDGILVRPASGEREKRARDLVERLKGQGTWEWTTDELMSLTRGEDWRNESPS